MHGEAVQSALEIDWNGVLPAERCSYVFGNPPFVGAKFQSPEQRAQVRRVADLGGSGGSLDYVAAWLLRAGEYVQRGTARIGFVAMYSVGVVYNTFPLPDADEERLRALAPYADAVLEARDQFPDSTLADLYAPDLMPAPLRQAHQRLDRAVDRLYRRAAFRSERERVEYLLALYERMVAPLDAAKPKRRRRR